MLNVIISTTFVKLERNEEKTRKTFYTRESKEKGLYTKLCHTCKFEKRGVCHSNKQPKLGMVRCQSFVQNLQILK